MHGFNHRGIETVPMDVAVSSGEQPVVVGNHLTWARFEVFLVKRDRLFISHFTDAQLKQIVVTDNQPAVTWSLMTWETCRP